MIVTFTKMHGLGNDFVIFDATQRPISLSAERVRRLADRRFGIGCDQVLLVEPPQQADVDFSYRIFNADGGEVEQCGNGARCFARFVHDKGLSSKTEIAVQTLSGIIYPRLEPDGQVRVNMGVPEFEPARIPFDAAQRQGSYELELAASAAQTVASSPVMRPIKISVVSMGNPHAVQLVSDIDMAPVSTQGPLIEAHPRFPKRVNAGYMQILDPGSIRVRVYERGAGETLACGTGACAAVVVGRQQGLLDAKVKVGLTGGTLSVEWQGEGQAVWLTGPAVTVYEGTIDLD